MASYWFHVSGHTGRFFIVVSLEVVRWKANSYKRFADKYYMVFVFPFVYSFESTGGASQPCFGQLGKYLLNASCFKSVFL